MSLLLAAGAYGFFALAAFLMVLALCQAARDWDREADRALEDRDGIDFDGGWSRR